MKRIEKEIRDEMEKRLAGQLLDDTRPCSFDHHADDIKEFIRETRTAVNELRRDMAAIEVGLGKLADLFNGDVSLEERLSWDEEVKS